MYRHDLHLLAQHLSLNPGSLLRTTLSLLLSALRPHISPATPVPNAMSSAWIYPPLLDAAAEEKPSSVLMLFSFLDGITGLYCFCLPSASIARLGFHDFFGTSSAMSASGAESSKTTIADALSVVVRILGKLLQPCPLRCAHPSL